MSEPDKKLAAIGIVCSILPSLLFLFSAAMKFKGGPDVEQGFAHLGLPVAMRLQLGILEVSCLAIYWVPRAAVLGAVLLTGYLGGAILAHWRVGDPVATHVVMGILVWLGIYLREPRLKALLPFRTRPS
ncbi:MAG TPA: DoxX family protein [Candidatus Eisenbacteria bacterium]|nr:DoxX family protein [Candidatus Eisenbacteria bacterium]